MKVITLWQPWASLWLTTAKVHETRHWATKHRGYLLVHAAKRPIDKHLDAALESICMAQFGEGWRASLPLGSIIGRVELLDCLSTNVHQPVDKTDRVCGNFSADRFMWKRGRFHVFTPPIPYKGMQGIFNVPDEFFLSLLNEVQK